uniref:Ion_trans_2 domain-containing protein n=1 Tax=Heterorhabditis bacteriophora TaxID=37862 RepID=A0A1I7WAB8_HETBA
MAAELLIHEPQITEEEVQRLADEPIQEWRFWHQKFDRFSFSPRSIGNGDTYVSAAKTMFDTFAFVYIYIYIICLCL